MLLTHSWCYLQCLLSYFPQYGITDSWNHMFSWSLLTLDLWISLLSHCYCLFFSSSQFKQFRTPWGNWTPLPTHFLYHVFWIASLCTLCISLTHLCTSKGTLTSSDKTKDFYSVPHILATKSSEDLKFLFFFYHSCFHKSFSVEGTNWR